MKMNVSIKMRKVKMCNLALVTTAMLALGATGGVAAADTKPAKAAQCEACHGAGGAAPIMPVYPKINGQNKEYLIAALKDYRDGKRMGPLSAVMNSQATSLTDAEIEELSEYYANQK